MDNIRRSNVLVVGAGGIGCELLKNLVKWNFKRITVIDLDTIDVSNLNRQFLFRKENVGKPKALIAKESALKFNPNVEIVAVHDDITNGKYDVDFFKTFNIVLNALDNKTARNHVNRMCLSADVPLLDGGTIGYRGQVQVILKGKTACYECYPKPAQKQYPACTIRNTPSEPIHCVVWAKFLFNQLFGEPDNDEDVVPDQNDPELTGIVTSNGDGPVSAPKVNVRTAWKVANEYNASLLLRILFIDSINSLLSMKALWLKENRKEPVTLSHDCIDADAYNAAEFISTVTGGVRDQEIFSLVQWCQILKRSAIELAHRCEQSVEPLSWDKDDAVAMDFVAAAANIRMTIFHIQPPMMTRFQIKSMAGNIIPAIPSTNAMIAGITVLHAYKILNGAADQCLDVMVSEFLLGRGKIFRTASPLTPVSNCYVCAQRHSLSLRCRSTQSVSLGDLKTVLQQQLKVQVPNVCLKNTAKIIIDGGDDDDDVDLIYLAKPLSTFDVTHGTVLKCSDFLRNYEFDLDVLISNECPVDGVLQLVGDVDSVIATARDEEEESHNQPEKNGQKRRLSDDAIDNESGPSASKLSKLDNSITVDDDDELIMTN